MWRWTSRPYRYVLLLPTHPPTLAFLRQHPKLKPYVSTTHPPTHPPTHLLQLVPTLLPTLAFLRKHPKLKAYVAPLERLLVVRLLKQLGGTSHPPTHPPNPTPQQLIRTPSISSSHPTNHPPTHPP